MARLPEASRATAGLLYEEHDALMALRAKAEKALLAEARKHREWHVLKTCPGLGPIRTAELLPVVVTPYRFQSRSRFWAYWRTGRGDAELVGLGAGPEWAMGNGTGTADAGAEPELQPHAEACLQGRSDDGDRSCRGRALVPSLRATPGRGTKPNLAKLTIARQLASIVLAVWRTGEAYDPKRLEATK